MDQWSGDKLYVFRVELPEGKTLETVEKGWFGESIVVITMALAPRVNAIG